jgi:hypothetical protein
MIPMNRRKFILFNFLCSLFPSLAGAAQLQTRSRALVAPATSDHALEIASLFNDLEAARAIGREYLRIYPVSRDPAALLLELALDGKSAPTEQLRRRVDAMRIADFQHGRTVDVNNWILPRTEAELCALALLLPVGA